MKPRPIRAAASRSDPGCGHGRSTHTPALTGTAGNHLRRKRPAAVAWYAPRAALYCDDTVSDCVNDPCYTLYLEALSELRRTLDELFPNDHHAGRLGPWYDALHRTQTEVVRLYDATLARVEARADP